MFVFISNLCYSQNISVMQMYVHDDFLINPALSGKIEYTKYHIMHRQKWLGMNGSPTFSAITFSSGLFKTGYGMYISKYSGNSFSETTFQFSYSYHLRDITTRWLGRIEHFSLGLSTVSSVEKRDVKASFKESTDILATDESLVHIDSNFGLYFKKSGVHFSGTAFNYIPRLNKSSNESFNEPNKSVNFIGALGYEYVRKTSEVTNQRFSLNSYVVYKKIGHLPDQADANIIFSYTGNNIGYKLGVSFRTFLEEFEVTGNRNILPVIRVRIKNYYISYAYNIIGDDFSGYGTHEILLGYRFKRDKGYDCNCED